MRDGDESSTGEALDALRAWLLTEDSFRRGGIPDEVLGFMQDHISRTFGSQAPAVAADFLREHVGDEGDLAELARRRPVLLELLARIEGERRRGVELEWRAARTTARTGAARRPAALLVMAEYGVGDPVWDRPLGSGDPVSLSELEVSDPLLQRLRNWNERFERLALTCFEWESPEVHAEWVERGRQLAQELQRELPATQVRYFHADDDRPRRGR